MFHRQLKIGYFVLEGFNSFSTVYYSYYLFFFMHQKFGFGNKENLALAAAGGLLYMAGSFWGGRLAQRFGYLTSLKLGFAISTAALAAGTQASSVSSQTTVMALVVLGMCFTWPALEALVSEGESPMGVQHMVGIYNIVWSGTAALAYFTGGAMQKHLGSKSLFWMPAAIQFAQLGLTIWLSKKDGQNARATPVVASKVSLSEAIMPSPVPPNGSKTFLTMAWLANPFAYIAINTLIAVIPGVAGRLGLSTMAAGFCCSIWCFSRLASFWWLWRWSGWHYRFRWLLAAYLALVGTFAIIVLAPNLATLVTAQIIFGGAVGLIYYSSLFYSMDRGANMGEHGGIHEAAIGLGNFAGPAIGATSLYLLPQYTNGAVLAVSAMLLLGLAGLMGIWREGRKIRNPESEARKFG